MKETVCWKCRTPVVVVVSNSSSGSEINVEDTKNIP